MIPPSSSWDQDAMDSGLEFSVNVMQGPRRQPGPQPNHLTGGVHQPGAVDVTVEAEPVAPAAAVAPPASADQSDQLPGEDTGVGDDATVEGEPVAPAAAVAPPASADQSDQLPGEDTGVGDDATVEGEPVAPAAAVAPPASADQSDQLPGEDTGAGDDPFTGNNTGGGDVVDLTVDPNQLDPVWKLRLSGVVTIFSAAMTALTLPGHLRTVHTTDERARLIASVGVPIGVAAVSLVVSFWLPSDPIRRSNWITRLSWLNTFMLGGHIFYWVFP